MAVSAMKLPRLPALAHVTRLTGDWAYPSLRRYLGWLHALRGVDPTAPEDPHWRATLHHARPGEARWIRACARVDLACRQRLGLAPFDGQWLAAMAMLDGRLAEMATGEGKTLAAGLAATMGALTGRQVQVMTANPYLVARDAAELAPLYDAFGLSHAWTDECHPPAERRLAYACDIVHATARTVAFDSLRDQVMAEGQTGSLMTGARVLAEGVQALPLLPAPDMVLIDEADSILIDEAAIPLIISMERPDPRARARAWTAWKLAAALEAGRDYRVDVTRREVVLLDPSLPAHPPLWINRRHRDEWLETALRARHLVQRDRDYVVRDDAICLIDAITGRIAEGRVWSRGLHTLVALKEGLPLPPETVTVAQTTYTAFFRRYRSLGGMSGTLREVAGELARAYRVGTVHIPLRKPCRRTSAPMRLHENDAALAIALIRRVRQLTARGRPVLIGTDTVAHSAEISAMLRLAGIAHRVLSAEQSAAEAAIVAAAGEPAAVTVATNIAGRGTDIRLGAAVAQAGGLHVLSLQTNRSARQDRQLIGRCARQGDPGSAEQWLSLERLVAERLPFTTLLRGLRATLGRAAAERLLPMLRRMHQTTLSTQARRQRARLQAGARYWDRHLPTSSSDDRTS